MKTKKPLFNFEKCKKSFKKRENGSRKYAEYDVFRILISFVILLFFLSLKYVVELNVATAAGYVIGRLIYIAAYVLACISLCDKKERGLKSGEEPSDFDLSISLCLICFSAITLLSFLLSESGVVFTPPAVKSDAYLGEMLLLSIFFHALIPAFAEEMYFRAFLNGKMRNYGPLFSLSVSSVLFSLAHFGSIGNMVYSLAAGVLLWLLYYSSRKIIYPIICHFSVNLLALIFPLFSEHSCAGKAVVISAVAVMLFGILYFLIRKRVKQTRYKKAICNKKIEEKENAN